MQILCVTIIQIFELAMLCVTKASLDIFIISEQNVSIMLVNVNMTSMSVVVRNEPMESLIGWKKCVAASDWLKHLLHSYYL